jgi:peroxiredoxin
MKKLLILMAPFLIIICSHSFGQANEKEDRGYIVKVGQIAPDFTIKEVNGKEYKLSDLRGKVVMLQFTASWCSVCRTEMPFIEKEIWEPWKKRGLALLGIDRDEPREKVIKFQKEMSITYPLALDPGADIFGLYADKNAGVTRNVIIDRSGKIVFLTRLYDRSEFEKMKTVISKVLNEK